MNNIILNESNYFSKEMSMRYCGSSQYKDFVGVRGIKGCEARALASILGFWKEEPSSAMVQGSYVDAHFEGTLGTFKQNNPFVFKKDGSLYAQYEFLQDVINRGERDQVFMQYMSGLKQVIMTANFACLDWKIKIDSYHVDKAIVDLKVMADINKKHYLPEIGYVNFIEFYGYDYQAAIYQKTVEVATGKKLPFFIAALTKEKPEPNLEIIQIEQTKLDACIAEIEDGYHTRRIQDLKSGLVEPDRCEECDYCRSTKILKGPIWSSDLIIR